MYQHVPGASTNPSAQRTAKKAEADTIKELKKNYGSIETKLTGLTQVTSSIRSEVATLEQQIGEASELKDTVKTLESEVRELQRFKGKATELLTALISSHSATGLQSSLNTAAIESGDPKAYYEALLQLPESSGEEEAGLNQPGAGAPSAMSNSGANQPGTLDATAAEEAASSRVFLDAVNQSLFFLSGVKKYHKCHSELHYPHGLTEADPEWPSFNTELEEGQPRKKLRFDLEKPHTDEVNRESFARLCQYVRLRGAQRVPAARIALSLVSDQQIEQRCAIKYAYEAGKYRKAMEGKRIPTKPLTESDEDDRDEQGALIHTSRRPAPRKSRKPPTSKYRTRAEGKLAIRTRRYNAMQPPAAPAEGQPTPTDWTQPKYRAGFLSIGAQSADETDYTQAADGTLTKSRKRFVSHPFDFLSQEFKDMKAAVDAIADPEPGDAYERKPGPTRPGPPPLNRVKGNCLRAWMVDQQVLADNPTWLTSGRVLPNGEYWGEMEPPAKRPKKHRRHSPDPIAGTSQAILTPEAKRARRELGREQTSLQEILHGQSLKGLLDQMAESEDEYEDDEEFDADEDE